MPKPFRLGPNAYRRQPERETREPVKLPSLRRWLKAPPVVKAKPRVSDDLPMTSDWMD